MDDSDILLANGKSKTTKEEKSNGKKSKDNFKFDANDARFGALFSNHLYHIDPSTQGFKKTQAFDDLVSVKTLKNNEKPLNSEDSEIKEKANVDLLIKSIKNKTQMSNINSKNVKKNK